MILWNKYLFIAFSTNINLDGPHRVDNLQGRRKVWKSRRALSTVVCIVYPLVEIGLTVLQKTGGGGGGMPNPQPFCLKPVFLCPKNKNFWTIFCCLKMNKFWTFWCSKIFSRLTASQKSVKLFSTDFIFRQQENLVDNEKCHAGFRLLCNKILMYYIEQFSFFLVVGSPMKDIFPGFIPGTGPPKGWWGTRWGHLFLIQFDCRIEFT